MGGHKSLTNSPVATTSALAYAIADIAQSDGDYTTAIPALSLHRRKMPTAPMHCIYGLCLGVVAQGRKQALPGGEVLDFDPGQSVPTSIAPPPLDHLTPASSPKPLLTT